MGESSSSESVHSGCREFLHDWLHISEISIWVDVQCQQFQVSSFSPLLSSPPVIVIERLSCLVFRGWLNVAALKLFYFIFLWSLADLHWSETFDRFCLSSVGVWEREEESVNIPKHTESIVRVLGKCLLQIPIHNIFKYEQLSEGVKIFSGVKTIIWSVKIISSLSCRFLHKNIKHIVLRFKSKHSAHVHSPDSRLDIFRVFLSCKQMMVRWVVQVVISVL